MSGWRLSALALSLAVLFGCVKMEQEITLNADGSGSVNFMYAMGEQMIAQMEAMKEMAKDMEGMEVEDTGFEFDEAKVREGFEKYQELGITLNNVKTDTRDGWRYVHLDFDFQDISRLREVEGFGEINLRIRKNEDGDYVISYAAGDDHDMMDTDPDMMAMMLPMLKGMRVATRINTPTDIISTTAPIRTARSAAFVIDVDEDPDSVKQLQRMKFEVVFSGEGVEIPEID